MDSIEDISVKHIELLFNNETYLEKYLDRIFFDVYERQSYQDDIDMMNKKLEKLKISDYDLTLHLEKLKL